MIRRVHDVHRLWYLRYEVYSRYLCYFCHAFVTTVLTNYVTDKLSKRTKTSHIAKHFLTKKFCHLFLELWLGIENDMNIILWFCNSLPCCWVPFHGSLTNICQIMFDGICLDVNTQWTTLIYCQQLWLYVVHIRECRSGIKIRPPPPATFFWKFTISHI